MSYLIYHPEREISQIGNLKVYHDNFNKNQDPYIWNKRFLHSFCHITQINPKEGDIIFWVSGIYPDFNSLICDCVFVVEEKVYWEKPNEIEENNKIVDNLQTFEHHYKWVNPPYREHFFRKRKRFTLKADKDKSFQPQDENQNLIDIFPFLHSQGITREKLISSISRTKNGKPAINSRPFKLTDEQSMKLYEHLDSKGKIKGEMIEKKHPYSLEAIEH